MKSFFLSAFFSIFVYSMSYAQCTITAGTITETQNGTSCNVQVCANMAGSPKQIKFEVLTPTTASRVICYNGGTITTFPTEPAGGCPGSGSSNQFPDGNYCYTFTFVSTSCANTSYTAQVTAFKNASSGGGGSCTSGVLPVVLHRFVAQSSTSDVKLLWETSEELNASHFEIQKSSNAIDFETIGHVTCVGNESKQKNTYQFVDENPSIGYNYYRLKQVDKGNAYEFTKIIVAKFMPEGDISIAPNPTSADHIRILSKGFAVDDVELFLTDVKKINTALKTEKEKEVYQVLIQDAVTSGHYILRITTALGTINHKLSIQ